MKTRIYLAAAALLILAGGCQKPPASKASSKSETNTAGGQEFHQRGGLPNFFQKVREGKEVRVAYIGGSITEASDGWRSLTFNWLRINYPRTPFTEINATIGGTGSSLGVSRMERDVLEQQPDLVFVEFAVNDFGQSPEHLYRTMEGIVRKTWKANPATDICFVYTVAENIFGDLLEGEYQPSAKAMEVIAEHYHIPTIHMGVEVARLQKEGKLVFTGKPEDHPGKIVFTTDKTHPLSKSGHPLYASVVRKYLEKMDDGAEPKPHALLAPYVADNWEVAKLIALPDPPAASSWERLPTTNPVAASFAKFMPDLYRATAPNAALRIKFRGSTLGFYDLVGPGSGMLDVTVDGKKKEMQRFDQYASNYRKSNFYLDKLSEGVHEVVVSVPMTNFDKAVFLERKKVTIDDPSRYAERSWYLSNILLVGELLSLQWE